MAPQHSMAVRLVGAVAWGAAWGIAFAVFAIVSGQLEGSGDALLSMAGAAVFAAAVGAELAPRIDGLKRLFALASLPGLAILVLTTHVGTESVQVLLFVALGIIELRLALDLFFRTWSPVRRRLAAALTTGALLYGLTATVNLVEGNETHWRGDHTVVMIGFGLLGVATIPPLRFSVPFLD